MDQRKSAGLKTAQYTNTPGGPVRLLFAPRLRICYGDNCLFTISRTFIDAPHPAA